MNAEELMAKPFLSVVIPVYNEGKRITSTLEKLSAYLRRKFEPFEVIVVDDGSTDNTVSIVTALAEKLGSIRLIRYGTNKGKGYAVREGVKISRGDLILMTDADLSTPVEELEKLFSFVQNGFDIVIGSRGLDESMIVVRQPWYREKMGKAFNILVRMFLIDGFKDTQCGFKLFRGNVARKLFRYSLINRFSFDVEILFLAQKAGYLINEVPIRWFNSPASKVNIFRDSIKMFIDLFRILAYWTAGKYIDKKN